MSVNLSFNCVKNKFVILCFLLSASVTGQVYESVVTEQRVQFRESGSRIVLKRDDLEQIEVGNLGQWLQRLEGVEVSAEGLGLQTVKVRGQLSQQLLVVLDGIPLSDPSDPTRSFDFTFLDLDLFEEVELLKGPQSAAYGAMAMAGVLKLTSRKVTEKSMSAHMKAGADSYGKFSGVLSVPLWRSVFLPVIENQEICGAQNIQSQTRACTANLQQKRGFIVGSTREWNLGATHNGKTQILFGQMRLKQDLDRGAYAPDSNATASKLNQWIGLRHYQSLGDKSALDFGYNFSETRRNQSDFADSSTSFPYSYEYQGRRQSADLKFEHRFDSHRFLLGTQYQRESLESLDLLSTGSQGSNEKSMGLLGFFSQISYSRKRFSSDFAARWDVQTLEKTSKYQRIGPTIQWGAQYRPLRSPAEVFYRIGKAKSAASLFQLQDPIYGNSQLRPESSLAQELGLRTYAEVVSLRWAGFFTKNNQSIEFSNLNSRYVNSGAFNQYGLELGITTDPKRTLFGDLSLYALFESQKNSLIERSVTHSSSVKGSNLIGWRLTDIVTLKWDVSAQSKRVVLQTQERAPFLLLWNLQADLESFFNGKLYLRIENLLNRSYQRLPGYESPERRAWVGFRVDIF